MRVIRNHQSGQFESALVMMLVSVCWGAAAAHALAGGFNQSQTAYPSPPSDRTLIYLADEKNNLTPLPFESATTPLRVGEVARGDKISYLELKGEHAATTVNAERPRFYLFVPDRQGVRPAFIVRLTNRKNARRAGATAQKGLSGFGVPSEEIIRPRLLVLKREDGMLFMEVSPRERLAPGDYAFLGSDLNRIATFRVLEAANP